MSTGRFDDELADNEERGRSTTMRVDAWKLGGIVTLVALVALNGCGAPEADGAAESVEESGRVVNV